MFLVICLMNVQQERWDRRGGRKEAEGFRRIAAMVKSGEN